MRGGPFSCPYAPVVRRAGRVPCPPRVPPPGAVSFRRRGPHPRRSFPPLSWLRSCPARSVRRRTGAAPPVRRSRRPLRGGARCSIRSSPRRAPPFFGERGSAGPPSRPQGIKEGPCAAAGGASGQKRTPPLSELRRGAAPKRVCGSCCVCWKVQRSGLQGVSASTLMWWPL